MDFLALTQRVHSESLRSTAAPTAVTGASAIHERIFNAVAAAWLEVQSERDDWKWMRATLDVALTIGQQTYTGTGLDATRFGRWRKQDDDYSAILYISGSPNSLWTVEHCPLDLFRKRWIYRTQGGTTPIEWTSDESEQLLVGPAPALAYMLRKDYWKEPSTLAADADKPDFPSRYHMLLVWRALQDIAKNDASPEVLAKAEKNYVDMHAKLVRDQALRLPYL